MLTDSSACKGICSRAGLGKVRHVEVALLWLQDMVKKQKVHTSKISGVTNPAYLITKYLTNPVIQQNLERIGCYVMHVSAAT